MAVAAMQGANQHIRSSSAIKYLAQGLKGNGTSDL